MPTVDVAIFGAGPVGATLALLLARTTSLRIALIDPHGPERALRDPRAIALSIGSWHTLARVIDPSAIRRAPIRTVHVSLRARMGRTVLRAADEGVSALGEVVRYADLAAALDAALANTRIELRRPASVRDWASDATGVQWTDDRGAATCALAVRAEGGVFGDDDAGADERRAYDQTAIVCEVTCTRPQPGVAFERFGRGGPLALLPLPEASRYAVVWCVPAEAAHALFTSDEAAFVEALHEAFGPTLGMFALAAPRASYPLGLTRRALRPDARTVRIGNAAQTLHPVAGQGLNLGLRDAFVLARCLRDGAPAHDMATVTARYRRLRSLDRHATVAMTDAFARAFALGDPIVERVAGIGLALVDQWPSARSRLARAMMFGQRR